MRNNGKVPREHPPRQSEGKPPVPPSDAATEGGSSSNQQNGTAPSCPRLQFLTAYALSPHAPELLPAGPKREWMNITPERSAYRCLPMLIANQTGWFILNQQKFTVVWTGGSAPEDLSINYLEPPLRKSVISIFGSGILTFGLGYLFRTPPGYNLHVRGPANLPKDGICPLEGVVESDWSEALFTMNWKVTRANHLITFDAAEPVAMITPAARHLLESFQPEIRDLADAPELEALHREWLTSRLRHNANLKNIGSPCVKSRWQRHYARGLSIRLEEAPDHQTGVTLKRFADQRSKPSGAT